MSVLQMQRISICAMKKDRKAILKDLQGFGAIEIETSKAGGDGLTKMDTLEDRQKFAECPRPRAFSPIGAQPPPPAHTGSRNKQG
mgnify:CR=1 FL=1